MFLRIIMNNYQDNDLSDALYKVFESLEINFIKTTKKKRNN